MASLAVSIDDSNFRAQVAKYLALSGRSFKDVLRQETGVILRKLSKSTAPFGNNKTSKLTGEKSLTRDIRKVYKTPAKVYSVITKTPISQAQGATKRDNKGRFLKKAKNPSARLAKAFYKRYKKGDYSGAERLLHKLRIPNYYTSRVGSFDGGAEHQSSRYGSRKRVPENTFAKLVTDNSNIKNYVAEKATWVGLAKSGWAYCAGLIGKTQDLAQWIQSADRGRSVGSVLFKGGISGMDGSYTCSNKVNYSVPQALSRSGFEGTVKQGKANMFMFFQKANEALIRKSGFRK